MSETYVVVKGFFLFVYLFGVLSSHSRIGDVTITGEGLQILIYALHARPLENEGSLACHAYSDTGHPFITVIPDVTERLAVELSLPLLRLRFVAAGI